MKLFGSKGKGCLEIGATGEFIHKCAECGGFVRFGRNVKGLGHFEPILQIIPPPLINR